MQTEMRVPIIVVDPLNSRPDITDKNNARKISSNRIIPKINSVSELAVRFKSTSTFATHCGRGDTYETSNNQSFHHRKIQQQNHKTN